MNKSGKNRCPCERESLIDSSPLAPVRRGEELGVRGRALGRVPVQFWTLFSVPNPRSPKRNSMVCAFPLTPSPSPPSTGARGDEPARGFDRNSHSREQSKVHRRVVPRSFANPTRRGLVSIWAIVCLVLVIAFSVTLSRLAIMGSRQMVQERRRAQADWLVQSGWSLARSQFGRDATYKGETWHVPANELGGADPGRVQIEITPSAADAPEGRHQVRVVAEFPAGSVNRVRVTRTGTWRKP